MSESARVQRWRQRQREAGKEPLTIWLTSAEKLHLEDMALTRHCSPSELVQHALAHLRGESPPVTDTVTDTEQIRAIVQHELTRTHTVTDTVTDTVTATLHQTLPGLVRALLQEQQLGIVTATVTDTITDTSTGPTVDLRPETATATVADTVTDTVSAPRVQRTAPSRQRAVTDTVADTVNVTEATPEPFDTTKYRLGTLCPRGHDYHGTGQSLRKNNKAGGCLACDAEQARYRRQARRQATAL